jgi:transitional endoplasmic reticulum ATPase
MVAKAVANASACNFISLSLPAIIHGEVGQSEKTLAAAFARAVQSAPCVVFFDEVCVDEVRMGPFLGKEEFGI